MTIEEAKKKYGDPYRNGYVLCDQCPIEQAGLGGSEECSVGGGCTGYKDCWEAIATYMTKQENPTAVEDTVTESNVNHPSHYNQGGIECIDAMLSAFGKERVCDFCLINAFKYLWRSKQKNGDEDVSKAKWYIDKYNELKGETN